MRRRLDGNASGGVVDIYEERRRSHRRHARSREGGPSRRRRPQDAAAPSRRADAPSTRAARRRVDAMPTKADQFETERKTRRLKLLEEVKTQTPLPDADALRNKSSRWKYIDAINADQIKKILPKLTIEDVPTKSSFLALGGKGDRGWLFCYVRFLIQDHAKQKRKALTALKREEKKARGEYDLRFEDLDAAARRVKWRAEIWNGKDKKVTMFLKKFVARTGPDVGAEGFWQALKAEENAALVSKAKADGDVREMTREVKQPDAFEPGQPNDGAMPFGAGTDKMSGAWSIGDADNEYIIGVVEEAAKRRGVSLEDMGADWARVLLKLKRALEQKLRRVGMDNNGRCVTTALTTGRDFTLLGVEAAERALAWLVAELRVTAMTDARVVALGISNRVDVRAEHVACDDAPSDCFGAAAGGVLGGGAASRGALSSGRLGEAYRRAAAVSDSAPASLGASFEGYDWARAVVESASKSSSASREPLVVMTDTGSEVSLDLRSPTFLADYARLFSRNLGEVPAINAALDKLGLHETPGGEGGLCLLRWGLMSFDPLTGKGMAGDFIEMCEKIDKEESRRKKLKVSGRFYAPKILHLALQKALVSGKLHFEDDLLSLFYCVYGKLFYALTFWVGDITCLKARDMGFDPTLIPLEVLPEEVKKMPASIAKRFPKGIVIESSDDLLPILLATNDKFFDFGKCVLWALAFAAYYGVGHPRARAALAAVAAYEKDHERAALRVAACEKAIDALTTGGDAGVSAVGAGACGDVLAAAPAPYVRFPSLKAALDAALMPCTFQIRFAFPARKRGAPRTTKWYEVDDLVPVCLALPGRDWDGVRSTTPWVFDSKLYRAMEDAACASSAVFAGTRLTEIAEPDSVVSVFDPSWECKRDQTYTIWAGVDFEIMMPDGTVISKSEFLLQELEKYMAARA